jgi:hypothetical protein
MIPPVSADETYVTADGRLTARGVILFKQIIAALGATGGRLDAVAAVAAPAGGATVDTQARAAIVAMLAAAA